MGYTASMSLRVLQLSDLHLGASLTGLPSDTAEALRAAVREVTAAAFEQAGQQSVELVLLPGDLFEQDGIEPAAQLRFVYEQAAALAPVPVVIAPGNHDAVSADSPYVTESVPGNVIVFTAGELQTIATPAGPVAGRGVQAGEGAGALRWSAVLAEQQDEESVLVLHASVLGVSDGRYRRNTVVPTTIEKLSETAFSYIALGHYHRFQEWVHPVRGLPFAAYAGCPQGLGWDEPGEKGYLIGELGAEGARLKFQPAAKHIWHRRELRLPPEHLPEAEAVLLAALQAVYDAVGPEDLLELRVSGRWPAAGRAELEKRAGDVLSRAWHARALDLSAVDFHPPLVGAGESELIDAFTALCDRGLAEVGADDEADAQAWQLARYLGLRLLSGQGLPGEVA